MFSEVRILNVAIGMWRSRPPEPETISYSGGLSGNTLKQNMVWDHAAPSWAAAAPPDSGDDSSADNELHVEVYLDRDSISFLTSPKLLCTEHAW